MRRVHALVLGVLGLGLAVVGFEFGDPWPYHLGQILGCVGTIGSLWALVLQYREVAPFEYPFTESSWEPYSPEEVCLEIARSEHLKERGIDQCTVPEVTLLALKPVPPVGHLIPVSGQPSHLLARILAKRKGRGTLFTEVPKRKVLRSSCVSR